jgi:hypothetical protein
MNSFRLSLSIGVAIAAIFLTNQSASAQSMRWYPFVIARGPDRQIIENTPIELRPNRPLHFYGNAVRRNYRRSTSFPEQPRTRRRGLNRR